MAYLGSLRIIAMTPPPWAVHDHQTHLEKYGGRQLVNIQHRWLRVLATVLRVFGGFLTVGFAWLVLLSPIELRQLRGRATRDELLPLLGGRVFRRSFPGTVYGAGQRAEVLLGQEHLLAFGGVGRGRRRGAGPRRISPEGGATGLFPGRTGAQPDSFALADHLHGNFAALQRRPQEAPAR